MLRPRSQVVVNARRQSADGLALPFLVNWLFGECRTGETRIDSSHTSRRCHQLDRMPLDGSAAIPGKSLASASSCRGCADCVEMAGGILLYHRSVPLLPVLLLHLECPTISPICGDDGLPYHHLASSIAHSPLPVAPSATLADAFESVSGRSPRADGRSVHFLVPAEQPTPAHAPALVLVFAFAPSGRHRPTARARSDGHIGIACGRHLCGDLPGGDRCRACGGARRAVQG